MSWGDRDKAPVSEVAELLRSASFGMFGLNHFETKIHEFSGLNFVNVSYMGRTENQRKITTV